MPNPGATKWFGRLGVLAAGAVLLACAGCWHGPDRRPGSSSSRVIVVGIDGLDIRLLNKLVAAGELPNFARLYREGSVGSIKTEETGWPPLSPRIWSTYATGRLPPAHGLDDFVYTDSSGTRRLFSSRQRKVPAAWGIVSSAGKRVGVVNWWFTYPAEKVNGFVISDRYLANWARKAAKFYGGKLDREQDELVYPPELASKLAGVVKDVNLRIRTAARAEAVDRNILEMAYAAVDAYPVDLLMIYTRALDTLSHLRWDTHEPRRGEKPKKDEIVAYMRRYDVMLGELMTRLVRPDDYFVVLSDHGFERKRGKKGPPGEHVSNATAEAATLILRGPRIRPGGRLKPVNSIDVLPTILELLDVPPSKRMPGRVVRSAFLPGQSDLLARVDRYERQPGEVSDRPATTDADADTIERLRMLGYMNKDEKD